MLNDDDELKTLVDKMRMKVIVADIIITRRAFIARMMDRYDVSYLHASVCFEWVASMLANLDDCCDDNHGV